MVNAQSPTNSSSAPGSSAPAGSASGSTSPTINDYQPPADSSGSTSASFSPPQRNSLPSRLQRNWKFIVAMVFFAVLIVGAGVGYYLSQQQQDVRQQAYGTPGQAEFFIGGFPEQGVIDQYTTCRLYDNPCASNTGEDSVCFCPGYENAIGSVGCTGANDPETAGFGPVKAERQGQGLSCAPICGDGIKHATEQCDDGNQVDNDGCSNSCTVPQPSPSPSPLVCGSTCESTGTNQCPTGHSCSPTSNTCVLTECLEEDANCDETQCDVVEPSPSPTPSPSPSPSVSPSPSPSPTPTPSPSPTVGCNDTCVSNSDCSNSSHICYSGRCRLDTNPDNASCAAASPTPSPSVVASSQPQLPEELPATGPQNWTQVILSGVGIVLAGAALLLLL